MIAAVIFTIITAAGAQTAYLQQFDDPDHTEPHTRTAMRMASASATRFVVAKMSAWRLHFSLALHDSVLVRVLL
jgi:mevalonate pyrophosphate decarboxylase